MPVRWASRWRAHEARELAVLGEKIRAAARAQHHVVHPLHARDRAASPSCSSPAPFAGPDKCQPQHLHRRPRPLRPQPDRHRHVARAWRCCTRAACCKSGEGLTHELIIGSRFEGRISGVTDVAGRPAVHTTIKGRAWITGYHHYRVDPTDPWPEGYVVADTWGTSTATRQE